MISPAFLMFLVIPALVLTALAPIFLVALVWRDLKEKTLW